MCVNCNETDCGCNNLTIPEGPPGRSISNTEVIGGELIIYFDDGTSQNLGTIVGADGNDGNDGADGNMWFDGVGDPGPPAANDGDYYLDTSTGDVYQLILGVWTLTGNIQGPEGPEGPAGPGGVATAFDFSSGTAYTLPNPNVIHDIAWSGVVLNPITDSFRYDFGDMQVINGTLAFDGTIGGGSADILIEIGGPLMSVGSTFPVAQVFGRVGVGFSPATAYVDNVGPTNYLRIRIDELNLAPGAGTWLMTYHLLLLYPV